MLWLDIEGTQYWSDQATNRAFFNSMISGAVSAGVHIGIYTSASQWTPIMGSFTGGAGYPLWYAHCTYPPIIPFESFSATLKLVHSKFSFKMISSSPAPY